MVAGLNHAMHSIDSPFADDGDGGGKRRNTGENRDARHHKPAPKDLDGFQMLNVFPIKAGLDGKILMEKF
ncbi:hypothetical protein LDL59_02360 [Kaistella anthropi]|nr:hypothetical protein [Kaistella anthropi]